MLPHLDTAGETIRALHQANQLLSYLRFYLLPHDPNYTEWGTRVVADGTATDTLPGGTQVFLDFAAARLIISQPDGSAAAISLAGHSQRSLFAALLAELRTSELAHVLTDDGDLVDQMIAALAVKKPSIAEQHDELTQTRPLSIDLQAAQDYNTALYSIFTGISRFKASRLSGAVTPAVVWGEHFDLAFLWFAAPGNAAHISFGFAPYSAGIDFPYLYAYAHPMTSEVAPTLPAPAYWHTAGWTGIVLPYSAIAPQTQPEQYIERMCDAFYTALLPLLG